MATSLTADEKRLVEFGSQLSIARGVWTILFGVFVLVWPQLTVVTFVTLLSLWLLVSGVTAIVGSLLNRNTVAHWFLRLIVGLVQVGVGAYLVQRPGVTLLTIVTLIAIALVVEGVVDIIGALFSGESFGDKLLSVIGGVLAIIIAVFIWRYPLHGTLAFLWLIGIYSLVAGSFMLAAGAQLRRAAR